MLSERKKIVHKYKTSNFFFIVRNVQNVRKIYLNCYKKPYFVPENIENITTGTTPRAYLKNL